MPSARGGQPSTRGNGGKVQSPRRFPGGPTPGAEAVALPSCLATRLVLRLRALPLHALWLLLRWGVPGLLPRDPRPLPRRAVLILGIQCHLCV